MLTVVPVVARTEKRGDGGTCDEVHQRVLMVGMWSLESGGRYFVGAFGKNLAGFSPLKHVLYSIYFVKNCTIIVFSI
jgi:hypothetical protein